MSNAEEKEYPSSGILLEMAKEEYRAERERSTGLDGKSSFFISVIIAVATIFIPIIPYGKLAKVFQGGTCSQKWLLGLFCIAILISFVFLILSFKKLYDAYRLRDYKRPSLDCISMEINHISPNDKVNKGLCDHYKTVVENNIGVNDTKVKSINVGIRMCGIGFLIMVIAAIGILVTVGG